MKNLSNRYFTKSITLLMTMEISIVGMGMYMQIERIDFTKQK